MPSKKQKKRSPSRRPRRRVTPEKLPVGESAIRELSVLSSCDPRTVKKVLRGQIVQALAFERISGVLRVKGLFTDQLQEQYERLGLL